MIAATTPYLIGLTGQSTSGKSTVAALLHMIGFEELSFATALRTEIVQLALGGLPDVPYIKPEWMLGILDIRNMGAGAVWEKPMWTSVRRLLQHYGTEFRRAQDENYWISRLPEIDVTKKYVVSDVRFENEAAHIRDHGGIIWHITRGSEVDPTHSSEACDFEPDLVLENNGSLNDLAEHVLLTLAMSSEVLSANA